jgi:hypothetical protein
MEVTGCSEMLVPMNRTTLRYIQEDTMKDIIFWDMTPCSPISSKLSTCLLAGFAELISSTLKM